MASLEVATRKKSATKPKDESRDSLSVRPTGQSVTLMNGLCEIVPLLARVIGSHCEIVLHDFSRLPNSIVAIGGGLTQREVGDPINTFALEKIRAGANEDLINYRVELSDGRALQSSTIFVRDDRGVAVGCICINLDMSHVVKLRDAVSSVARLLGVDDQLHSESELRVNETFPKTVDEVMAEAVSEAIREVGVEPELMHKRHKVHAVRLLEERGLFLVRDAVDYVARELGVSRFTIYNYLNELRGQEVEKA
ncbi:MAG: PAS domain-containing protein [Acidobacteria bacterium]|nr:PAS domain-containing protein [Acidobacteriota bacterium]